MPPPTSVTDVFAPGFCVKLTGGDITHTASFLASHIAIKSFAIAIQSDPDPVRAASNGGAIRMLTS